MGQEINEVSDIGRVQLEVVDSYISAGDEHYLLIIMLAIGPFKLESDQISLLFFIYVLVSECRNQRSTLALCGVCTGTSSLCSLY